MYSILPRKIDTYVSTTHEVSKEALKAFPQNPHHYGWLCKDGKWFAGWYPDLGEEHHTYVYHYQCIIVPLKGSLYMPRTKDNWRHFEDAPDEVEKMNASAPRGKRARLSKAAVRYRRQFSEAYKVCKERYEAAKEAWMEKHRTNPSQHDLETLCVGDVISYAHPLPNFQTRILEIRPIAYYADEREACCAKLRALRVADVAGAICFGSNGGSFRITKHLPDGSRSVRIIGLWNIEPEGRLAEAQSFEDAVGKIAESTKKVIEDGIIEILNETESESDQTDSEEL